MKKAFLVVLDLLMLGALLFAPEGMPFGLKSIQAREAKVQESLQQEMDYNALAERAERSLTLAVSEFNDARKFDIYYGDIPRLKEVLNGIAGISVQNVIEVLPMEGFREGIYVTDESEPAACKFELVVSDMVTALSVLERMELPVYSVYIEYPNRLDVTFMTGGTV